MPAALAQWTESFSQIEPQIRKSEGWSFTPSPGPPGSRAEAGGRQRESPSDHPRPPLGGVSPGPPTGRGARGRSPLLPRSQQGEEGILLAEWRSHPPGSSPHPGLPGLLPTWAGLSPSVCTTGVLMSEPSKVVFGEARGSAHRCILQTINAHVVKDRVVKNTAFCWWRGEGAGSGNCEGCSDAWE